MEKYFAGRTWPSVEFEISSSGRTARTMSSRPPRLNAVAYISAAQSPILVRTFVPNKQDDLKYHYIAHTSLDVIEERGPPICRNSIDFWS